MTGFAGSLGIVFRGGQVAGFTLSGDPGVIEGGLLPGRGAVAGRAEAGIVVGRGIIGVAGFAVGIAFVIEIRFSPVSGGVTAGTLA